MIAFEYINEVGITQVAVCSLASSVPEGTPYIETQEAPEDKLFRSAWVLGAASIDTDVTQAKEIMHSKRRVHREKLFFPHDEVISKQIPGKDAVAAENARQVIRNADAVLQDSINACETEEDLRSWLSFIED